MLSSNVQAGKFEFKKGNTLAMFAEAFAEGLETSLKDWQGAKIPFDMISGK